MHSPSPIHTLASPHIDTRVSPRIDTHSGFHNAVLRITLVRALQMRERAY